jgi:ethanolamine utilization microcompartment shell protein EutS
MVGIMVDGLQQRHLDQLWTRFDANGLRKLAGEGAKLERLACNIVSTGNATDITTLLTGTVPYYHGVVSTNVYDRSADKIISVFNDKSQSGIETNLKLSAKNMRANSIVDELVLANQGNSKSYAIGINPEDAIAMGGHASNGVVWMDDVLMKWSSSAFYKDGMPWQALDMNSNGSFQRIIDRTWQPLHLPNSYIVALNEKNARTFEYKITQKKSANSAVSILKTTPSANSLVAELALRVFREEKLGMDRFTDALMLQFTVRTPYEKKLSVQSLEKEDMYLRLDNELQFMMQKIEGAVGKENVLFVLYGNQTSTYSPEELKENNIYAGYFNANRSMALLSSYLMAIYGPEKWIEGYYGKHIYLNKPLIEEKNIDFKELQEVAKEFILEFEGVQSAYSFSQLMNIAASTENVMAKIRNSSHKNSAGDIILTLMPGWLEVDDDASPVGETDALVSYLPLYFYGGKITQQTITTKYHITDVAPTLSDILQIAYPNAAIGNSIRLEVSDE